VTIPSSSFGPGENRVLVTSVNADSEVGTFPEELLVTLNVRPPAVESSSHPVEDAWGGSDDVYLSWTDPAGVPEDAWAGYFYAWDRQADTVPSAAAGTFDDRRSLLQPDQLAGIWFFHIVNIDRMGRTSPLTAHRQVRVGPDPGTGNVAGTVTDAGTGDAIAGATVLLNGGLLRAVSGETGDYTFLGAAPASTEPYRITASARGYLASEDVVAIGAGSAEVLDFALEPDPEAPASGYGLGWEFQISSAMAGGDPAIAVGPSGRYIWSRAGATAAEEEVAIIRSTGDVVMTETTWEEYYSWGARTEVGWNGDRFYALEYFKCDDDGSLRFGHGWSCLRMRTWTAGGGVLDGWVTYANSGHSGSPSVAWNGSTFGTFFISYSALFYRELTEDLELANGGGAYDNTSVASGYGDTRQSARTRAIWDGDGHAVAWSLEDASSSALTLYFGRWDADLGVLQAPITVDPSTSSNIGLVWDGSVYHLAYVQVRGAERDLVLRAVERDGTLGERTVLVGDIPSWITEPSLGWDGRALLVAWGGGADGYEGVLEVRSAADHSLAETVDLGHAGRPRIAVRPETAEAVVLYERSDRPGTYIRQVFVE
jgi:hypothetical protein